MVGGKCIKFGDSVNTDIIIPGRYLISIDPKELAEHAFEPLGLEIQKQLQNSQVVVGGRNFGCGSAREQAATCLIGAGIKVVIAKSFARVFFRNSINTGLLAVECPEAVEAIEDGASAFVDTENGIVNVGEQSFQFTPYPESLRKILNAGGLIPFVEETVLSEGR
ncbi:3-isopropylmalate dehydratase small subunit [Halalkalibacter alkaliphilus]|uniref:3-isopropylmalate dehydratase small subunit n=1 Tax=Halalkalibacter alkaliphilus TaxID=2917993 RepID=A0A9X2CUL8_9BACI|nr:3-isopropylmalate dehydratase small subunit [Halalkalibacter alkaliphilus]MCL7748549.1 3-isopropylmalate dehydratase small subunit [Halalkalibacter alkaliphilus]